MSCKPHLTLTAARLAEIENAILNDQREFVRRRAKAIWLKHHGHHVESIAIECGVNSRNTIYYWFRAFKIGGIEALARPNGRLGKEGLHAALTDFGVDPPLNVTTTLYDRVTETMNLPLGEEQFDDVILALGGRLVMPSGMGDNSSGMLTMKKTG